jgi:hypothetical protein
VDEDGRTEQAVHMASLYSEATRRVLVGTASRFTAASAED